MPTATTSTSGGAASRSTSLQGGGGSVRGRTVAASAYGIEFSKRRYRNGFAQAPRSPHWHRRSRERALSPGARQGGQAWPGGRAQEREGGTQVQGRHLAGQPGRGERSGAAGREGVTKGNPSLTMSAPTRDAI